MSVARKSAFAILFLAVYLAVVYFTLTPKYVWVHPEVQTFDTFTVGYPASAIAKTFNWHQYEFVPRFTRPLSNFVQIVEGGLRYKLQVSVVPHWPSFSPVVWLLCLIGTPMLTLRLLRALGAPLDIALGGALLAVVNPVNLSHLALYFRPGKALSEFFFIAVALVFVRLLQHPRASLGIRWLLGACLLLGFFSDEYGALAYLFVLIFGGWTLWERRREVGPVLIVAPLIACVGYFYLFPKLGLWLWGLEGSTSSYFIFDKILRVSNPIEAVWDQTRWVFTLFLDHLWIFVSETLGLMWGPKPSGWGQILIYVNNLTVLVWAVAMGRHLWRDRQSPIWKFLILFVLTIAFHSLLMSFVNAPYGPYYYGGIASLTLLIAFALGLNTLPAWVRIAVLAPLVFTNIFVAVHTNQAMKRFHFYPSSFDFIYMFKAELNRFELPFITPNTVVELHRLREMRPGECRWLPHELYWYPTTTGFKRASEPTRDGPKTAANCAGSTCCSVENHPSCFLFCGNY